MIKIDKNRAKPPAILATDGVAATISNNLLYNKGIRKFTIDKKIYGHSSVKKKLIRIQHDKCCYCECRISASEYGHIEHFRPKGGYKKDDNSRLIKPGYYWLAYDFSNLFLSCSKCNSSHKKNYFPIANEVNRALDYTYDISKEDILIIDPSTDPAVHLVFKSEIIKPRNKSDRGKETIKRTGLNRKALAYERLELLITLRILAKLARNGDPESIALFKKRGRKNSAFSYMIVCNFPDLV